MTPHRKRATSEAAAEAIRLDTNRLRQEVFGAIKRAGNSGLTDEEGQAALEMNGNTYRPRRLELAERGWVKSASVRPTRAGRMAQVWVVA